jgi:hypothetical protein
MQAEQYKSNYKDSTRTKIQHKSSTNTQERSTQQTKESNIGAVGK